MEILTKGYSKTEPLEIRLRRNEDTLNAVGTGVIFFGIWSILKTVFTYVLRVRNVFEYLDMEPASMFERVVIIFFLGVFLLFDLGFRISVGMAARTVGRGRRSRFIFVIGAFILAFFSAAYVVNGIRGYLAGNLPTTETNVGILVEFTSLITLTQLINSALAVRSIRKKLEKQG